METSVNISVGRTGADVQALKKEIGEDTLDNADHAWSYIVQSITYMRILQRIIAAGSPSECWSIKRKLYSPQADAEKASLSQSSYSLRMKDGELPIE